jgi:DnaJ family protein A protein 5
MRKENERLNLDNPTNGQPNNTASGPGSLDNNQEETKKDTKAPSSDHLPNGASDGQGEGHSAINTTAETISEQEHKVQVESASDTSDPPDVDDEYASRRDVESRRFGSISGKLAQGSLDDSTAATSAASDGDGSQKLGKAKLKRAKKKARQEQEDQESQEARIFVS